MLPSPALRHLVRPSTWRRPLALRTGSMSAPSLGRSSPSSHTPSPCRQTAPFAALSLSLTNAICASYHLPATAEAVPAGTAAAPEAAGVSAPVASAGTPRPATDGQGSTAAVHRPEEHPWHERFDVKEDRVLHKRCVPGTPCTPCSLQPAGVAGLGRVKSDVSTHSTAASIVTAVQTKRTCRTYATVQDMCTCGTQRCLRRAARSCVCV